MSSFTLNNITSQKGKIAIVTGANSGLGFETTKALAKKDFLVVMACRNLDKAKKAKALLLEENPSANLNCMVLDLADLQSIRVFSEEYLVQYSQLDLLVNNAGIMMPPYSTTKDGFESQFGANFLGHFLLTGLLIDCLKNTLSSRVVTLSSLAHNWAEVYFDDLNFKKSYDKRLSYGQSKLACLMFAYELDRRLKAAGLDIKSVAAHPGVSTTNLTRHMPNWTVGLMNILGSFLFQNPENGSKPTLRAALDPNAEGGDYYGPDGFKELKGDAVKVTSSKKSHDVETAKKLWAISEELTDIDFLS